VIAALPLRFLRAAAGIIILRAYDETPLPGARDPTAVSRYSGKMLPGRARVTGTVAR
jgi:hypothetical protein